MGIKGLLPMLKSIHKHCTLKKFSGQTIGVDAYGWLHRGVVGCAFALALDKPTTVHIDFVLSRVRMLIDFGVTPYLVFDGDNLPSKAGTNAARRKKRQESRALGLELHKAGKTTQAQQELQKAIDVTPLMARQLIEELKKLNVQYVVAPYEADAQLVYLENKGIIDGILAEDSDMLVFGAKRLLTKLNQYGELVEIERADFALCKDINLAGWTDAMFRRMAILSGCDYLPNIGKLGLKTAHSLVRKHNDVDRILRLVQLEGKMTVPSGYQDEFQNAELTFLHHRVFCPITHRMVFLTELTPGLSEDDMPFLGPYVEAETAIGVACGDLDPFSKKAMQLNKSLARPALSEQRRQSYASMPDLKSKKSIDTFFQPNRLPLAELDPNSLTPSPSQQSLLERNRNASWEPRLVSSAPSLRRSTTVAAALPESVERSTFLARASTLSTYQPPKRQRLCSDSMDPSPQKEVKQSPFFSNASNEASPLAQKAQKIRRAHKTKFEVFADDNSEMLLGPAIQQVASPEKNVHSHMPVQAQVQAPQPAHESQESITQSSPIGSPQPENKNSIGDSASCASTRREISLANDPDAFVDLLEFHVQQQNKTLRKTKGSLMETFAFQPQEQREQALRSLSHPVAAQQPYVGVSDELRRRTIQVLPKETDINSFCKTLTPAQTWDRLPSDAQLSALKSLKKQSPSATEPVESGYASNKICSKLRQATSPGVVRGSEDSLVPNSEDECSEIGSPKPKFDLRAFAYVST